MIEEEKLIPLTQCSLLAEHSFISSCHNSNKHFKTLKSNSQDILQQLNEMHGCKLKNQNNWFTIDKTVNIILLRSVDVIMLAITST